MDRRPLKRWSLLQTGQNSLLLIFFKNCGWLKTSPKRPFIDFFLLNALKLEYVFWSKKSIYFCFSQCLSGQAQRWKKWSPSNKNFFVDIYTNKQIILTGFIRNVRRPLRIICIFPLGVTEWNHSYQSGFFPFLFQQDVWQYFLNLTQANLLNKPDWLIEYKATEAFSIPDVSPQSLHSLVQTFKSKESANFRKYYLFNSVSAGGEQCDEDCKNAQICGITKIDFDLYDDCLNPPSNRSTVPSESSTIPSNARSVRFSLITVVFWLFSVVLFTQAFTD